MSGKIPNANGKTYNANVKFTMRTVKVANESVSFIHKICSTESVFYRKYKDLV